MKTRNLILGVLVLAMLAITGCVQGGNNTGPEDQAVPEQFRQVPCQLEQRGAEICTMDYTPVCGSDGNTYSNACAACIDDSVEYWVAGECKDEPKACTEEAKLCPDGSAVARDPKNNCEFPACPSEEFRRYVNRNVTVCAATTFVCVNGTQQFFDETGCGCEPKEPRKVISDDPKQCELIRYVCIKNYVAYSDETGCGCKFDWSLIDPESVECPDERPQACTMDYNPVCGKLILNTGKEAYQTFGNGCVACSSMKVVSYKEGECKPAGKVLATDCTDPRPTACTKEYEPVCGQVQVQCITTPCEPVMETFDNKCMACANGFTISWFDGECPQ